MASISYLPNKYYAVAFFEYAAVDNNRVVLDANALDTPGRADGNHKGSNDSAMPESVGRIPSDAMCFRALMKIAVCIRLTFTES